MQFRDLAIAGVLLVAVAVAAVTVVNGVLAWGWDERRLRSELDRARNDRDAGRFDLARHRLRRLAERWPREAEVVLELGRCELANGHPEEALTAWARAPERAPLAGRIAMERAGLTTRLGRLTEAEAILRAAIDRPCPEAADLRRMLVGLLMQQGRLDDARRLIEGQWEALGRSRPDSLDQRLTLLRDHIALDLDIVPLEGNMAQVRAQPDVDDVGLRLARAHLATRSGRFDQARAELEAARKRRPDAPVVWRAWLDWAVAAGGVGPAREAIGHLSPDALDPARLQSLRAWIAARRGDIQAERRALEGLVALDPGDPAALTRLAELTQQAGDAAAAARLRRRKAELDADRERYFRLYKENLFSRHVAELARLAERLGRGFEARGFWALVRRQDPSDQEAMAALDRLAPAHRPAGEPTGRLASMLADERGSAAPPDENGSIRATEGVPDPIPDFHDRSRESGLDSFVFDNGASAIHQLPEMSGGGIGLIDFDGDGWLDVYAVQGGPFPPRPDGDAPGPGDRLFRNRGDGTFRDVTDTAGIGSLPRGYGHAVAVGDFDNDGHPDLFLTRWRSYALWRNRGDGTFEDATARAGLGGDRDWPTSAAFADLDGDGDLDLYVCHYGVWDSDHPRLCKNPFGSGYLSCDPRSIEPLPDHVFRNDGGRFVDVTAEAGLLETGGRGLGVVAADLDDDGRTDVFVANDTTANYLFHNLGGFRFEEIGTVAGVAANAAGGYQAGMGVACGDLDGDGRLDLAVTNFYLESTSFFRNLGQDNFADRTTAIGLAAPSRHRLGFGIAFLDANNDGRLDLMTANGHISDMRPLIPLAMSAQLFLGGDGRRLADVTDRAGPPFAQPHVGRGLAVGDLDNDGRLDALMVAQNEPLVAFHNRTEPRGHFVTFRLEGTRSNRGGVGARVTLSAGGRRQVAACLGGGSYASAGDPRLHFGLGSSREVESVEIRWPSGRVDRYEHLVTDTGYLLREGDPRPGPLAGFRSPLVERDRRRAAER